MFTDAEEIEENFRDCGRLQKQFSDEILEQEKIYEQHVKARLDLGLWI
jgi:hypothetical protein